MSLASVSASAAYWTTRPFGKAMILPMATGGM
jgi:hypothetical protein